MIPQGRRGVRLQAGKALWLHGDTYISDMIKYPPRSWESRHLLLARSVSMTTSRKGYPSLEPKLSRLFMFHSPGSLQDNVSCMLQAADTAPPVNLQLDSEIKAFARVMPRRLLGDCPSGDGQSPHASTSATVFLAAERQLWVASLVSLSPFFDTPNRPDRLSAAPINLNRRQRG